MEIFWILVFGFLPFGFGILYPQRNEIRGLDSLDGLWTFVREPLDGSGIGFENEWYKRDLRRFPNATRMPVPSAFNELTADRELRLFTGWVWYQTDYRVPRVYANNRIILRFGSVNYYAKVFINGVHFQTHIGGHLPFEVELVPNSGLQTQIYIITVAVNNTLHQESIPPGEYKVVPYGNSSFYVSSVPDFDFFNYGGILRSVWVQYLSTTFLRNLRIHNIKQNSFTYVLNISSNSPKPVKTLVCLFGPTGDRVGCVTAPNQFAPLESAELWFPRGYGSQPLYTLEVSLFVDSVLVDIYRETFGFRIVSLKENKLYINGKPFYCVGFGMHEDFYLHGRGYDPVVMTRDLNMFEWMNGNCYRTSHYPYSEERAYEADRRGIVVITETPAVGIRYFNPKTLKTHENILREMIERDSNHPSVIAWSIANEPESNRPEAREYFRRLAVVAHSEDPFRLVTTVYGPSSSWNDQSADFMDFICVNHYDGWYQNMDHPEVVNDQMYGLITEWSRKFKKPIVITEYGAEAIPGMYSEPSIPFSEQYQWELVRENHKAFDRLRSENIISGEMIWNFADFMTAASTTRVLGNHKGVLTRDRQPKPVAYQIKYRYANITKQK